MKIGQITWIHLKQHDDRTRHELRRVWDKKSWQHEFPWGLIQPFSHRTQHICVCVCTTPMGIMALTWPAWFFLDMISLLRGRQGFAGTRLQRPVPSTVGSPWHFRGCCATAMQLTIWTKTPEKSGDYNYSRLFVKLCIFWTLHNDEIYVIWVHIWYMYIIYKRMYVYMCFLFVKQLPSSFFMTGIYSGFLPFLLEKIVVLKRRGGP